MAGVHFRKHHAAYDDVDLGTNFFENNSPLFLFTRRVSQLPPARRVYVSSTCHEAKLALRDAHPAQNVTWSSSAAANAASASSAASAGRGSARADFAADWFALSECDSIIGSYGSSFSDEAVHRRGITKEILTGQPAVQRGESEYHALHFVVGGRRYVSGWSEPLADLYLQHDPSRVHETFEMEDPLLRLSPRSARGSQKQSVADLL
mgnify:CR=1 FL=1